jgi:hypothetical protein
MTMITRENKDTVMQRVALLAFLYYPQVHVNEVGYSLSDDIEFCLEPLTEIDAGKRDELRHLLGQAIIDPSEYREEVFAALTELVTEDSVQQ